MIAQDTLAAVCDRLEQEYSAHTILLYGSMADGSANADSDIDLAAFAAVDQDIRVAELFHGAFLDCFVYPESILGAPEEEHLRLRSAKVLRQRNGSGTAFIELLEKRYKEGPIALTADEAAARRIWARKMIARIQRGDVDGNYRRSSLLTALLEDYFHLRGLWFEGPKKSFAWLLANDPGTFDAMEAALVPAAPVSAIEHAIDLVMAESAVI